MNKIFTSKRAMLILGGISLLVIILLIASLDGLEFKPAKPFTYVQETSASSHDGLPPWNGIGIVIVIFAGLLVILLFFLSPEQRKRYFKIFLWVVLAGIIIFLIFSRFTLGSQVRPPPETPGEVFLTRVAKITDTPWPETTPAIFTPPQVSSWTSYLVALLFLLVVASIGGWLAWHKRRKGVPFDALAEIAQSALADLESGEVWGNAIMNCYYRMNKVVAEWRGFHRQLSMTPAEFAGHLVSMHLPKEAVNHLTELFERVRYSNKKPAPKDIQEAVDCLTLIVEYCQGEK